MLMFNNLYGVSSCVWEQMDTVQVGMYKLSSGQARGHTQITPLKKQDIPHKLR